jgi:hypothetical protein
MTSIWTIWTFSHAGGRVSVEHDDPDVPDWLRNEFEDAGGVSNARSMTKEQQRNSGRRRDSGVRNREGGAQQQRGMGRKEAASAAAAAEMLNNKTLDYKRKLEKEFNQKQIEIRMEAQNAVREREKVLNEEVNRLREQLEKQKTSQAVRDGVRQYFYNFSIFFFSFSKSLLNCF